MNKVGRPDKESKLLGAPIIAATRKRGETTVYIEERIYVLQFSKVPEYFRLYEAEGLAIQTRHLPHMAGYYFTEVGTQNQVVHLWAYEDLDQRERCRAALMADPAWRAYVAKIAPLIVTQETRLMKCAPFFLERLKKMLAAAK